MRDKSAGLQGLEALAYIAIGSSFSLKEIGLRNEEQVKKSYSYLKKFSDSLIT